MNRDILQTFNRGSPTIKFGLFAIEANRPHRLGSNRKFE
jgi:hypothetical protein